MHIWLGMLCLMVFCCIGVRTAFAQDGADRPAPGVQQDNVQSGGNSSGYENEPTVAPATPVPDSTEDSSSPSRAPASTNASSSSSSSSSPPQLQQPSAPSAATTVTGNTTSTTTTITTPINGTNQSVPRLDSSRPASLIPPNDSRFDNATQDSGRTQSQARIYIGHFSGPEDIDADDSLFYKLRTGQKEPLKEEMAEIPSTIQDQLVKTIRQRLGASAVSDDPHSEYKLTGVIDKIEFEGSMLFGASLEIRASAKLVRSGTVVLRIPMHAFHVRTNSHEDPMSIFEGQLIPELATYVADKVVPLIRADEQQ